MKAKRVEPTLTEIIAVLAHSTAPTLVVEGRDDYVALREFEIENIENGFTVLPVYGKQNVLDVVSRRDEISNKAIAFLVDKDCWCFTEIPGHYQRPDILTTDGFSIENDLLRDGDVFKLLKGTERDNYQRDLAAVVRYFSVAAWKHCSEEDFLAFSASPESILETVGCLKPAIEQQISLVEENLPNEFKAVYNDPHKLLRGKTLVSLLTRYLSHTNRLSKFSKSNLLEIGAVSRGQFQSNLEVRVRIFMEPFF